MTRENGTFYRDYDDIAQEMIGGLSDGVLPDVGTLQYMYGMSEAGRFQAELVTDAILADPQLTERFAAAITAFKAEQATEAL